MPIAIFTVAGAPQCTAGGKATVPPSPCWSHARNENVTSGATAPPASTRTTTPVAGSGTVADSRGSDGGSTISNATAGVRSSVVASVIALVAPMSITTFWGSATGGVSRSVTCENGANTSGVALTSAVTAPSGSTGASAGA